MSSDHPNSIKKLIIITAPSGAGKTSITRYLLDKISALSFSVSATTRAQRSYEVNGRDYYFISEDEFKNKISNQEFVEWEMVYKGKYYGTLHSELKRIWDLEKIPMLDIDVKGAIHVMQQCAGRCLTIFVQPPSIGELQRRLETRGTETMETLEARLNKASYELSFSHQFNHIIINENLEKACTETELIVRNFLTV
jgi:guanylate kinase